MIGPGRMDLLVGTGLGKGGLGLFVESSQIAPLFGFGNRAGVGFGTGRREVAGQRLVDILSAQNVDKKVRRTYVTAYDSHEIHRSIECSTCIRRLSIRRHFCGRISLIHCIGFGLSGLCVDFIH